MEARADSAYFALMFLIAGLVMGGAVFLQVSELMINPKNCPRLREFTRYGQAAVSGNLSFLNHFT